MKGKELGEHLPTVAGNILALLVDLEITAVARSLNLDR